MKQNAAFGGEAISFRFACALLWFNNSDGGIDNRKQLRHSASRFTPFIKA